MKHTLNTTTTHPHLYPGDHHHHAFTQGNPYTTHLHHAKDADSPAMHVPIGMRATGAHCSMCGMCVEQAYQHAQKATDPTNGLHPAKDTPLPLQANMEALQREYGSLEQRCESLQADNEELRAERREAVGSVGQLQAALQALGQENEELQAENEGLVDQLQHARELASSWQGRYEEEVDTSQDLAAALRGLREEHYESHRHSDAPERLVKLMVQVRQYAMEWDDQPGVQQRLLDMLPATWRTSWGLAGMWATCPDLGRVLIREAAPTDDGKLAVLYQDGEELVEGLTPAHALHEFRTERGVGPF